MPRITKIEDLMFPVELRLVYYTNTEIDGKEYKNIPNSRVVVNKESGKPLSVVSNNINSSQTKKLWRWANSAALTFLAPMRLVTLRCST